MLSKDQLAKQREILLAEEKRLKEEITELDQYPDYGDQYDDDVQELTDFENMLSVKERLNIVLKKVSKAIEAIDTGIYGRCKICSQYIENGRLEAIPYAEICVTCSSKKDKS